jgi:hypothetical protein
VKKLLIFSLLIFVALINSYGADRTGTIPSGLTMLSKPFTFAASDTVVTGTTTTYLITNLQKYMQNQVFTIGLTAVTGTHNMTITAYGKVAYGGSLAGGTWVQIGTPITWVTAANNGAITSTSPVNYNYFKVTFSDAGSECKALVSQFEIKTSNAYDIPASSGTLTIGRATTGTVTVQVKDDDANAAAVYRAGGSGALTIGAAAGTTAITSSDWAISATGVQTGMGAATFDGLITATAGLSFATGSTVFWAKGGAPMAVADGTDVAATNGARWWTEIEIPHNATITGLSYLVGSVGGTDSVMVNLFNSAGSLVATSKKAGAAHGDLVATAAEIQSVAFATPYAAVAGKYFASVQFNGTTAKFRAYLIPGSKFVANTAAGTYDTAAASITPGTTFVVNKGPIIATY